MKPTRKSRRNRNTSITAVTKPKDKLKTSGYDLDANGMLDDSWISATSTYNYMMKDPLLDWLKYHHGSFVHKNRRYRKAVDQSSPELKKNFDKTGFNFTSYIMEQGVTFEKKVMKLLTKKFGPDRIAELHGEEAPRDPKKYEETLDAMRRGVPIIHSGVLHDPEHKTFGIPDLLVRSDWLKFLVNECPYIVPEVAKISSPKLGRPWHYRVVDIKFTGLLLRADAGHLLNAASFPAYKSQLLIYNMGLGYAQGYTPGETYILGRGWRYKSKGETHSNNTCFDKFGIINYVALDRKYVEQTEKALKWLREVRSEEAADWNITKYPLHRWELYPNMCNSHDYPWHAVKEQLAEETKELTNLWMVGPKNRAIALDAGICQWTDPNCTTQALGVTGKKTSHILHEILRVNRSKKLKIIPNIIKNDIGDWKNPQDIEFFVDFETCNGVVSGIKRLPSARTETIIFMIGVGYVDPLTKKWVAKDFVVDRLTLKEEERICREFSTFISEKAAEHGVNTPRCIHWARAEDSMWTDVVERHDPISNQWKPWAWKWVDLLEVFKEEPIVINGCMSFGLKDVASAMKKHGFIESEWDKMSACIDGQSAMVAARKAYYTARKSNISMKDIPIMKQIRQYNRVDVRVLYEILTYLRENHTGMVSNKSQSKKRKYADIESESEEQEKPRKRARVQRKLHIATKDELPQKRKRPRDESDGSEITQPQRKRARKEPQEPEESQEIKESSVDEDPPKRGRKRAREDDTESSPSKKKRSSSPNSDSSESMLEAMNESEHAVDPVADDTTQHSLGLRSRLRPRR